MAMTYIILHHDLSRTVDKFSDDEAGRLLKALLHYGAGNDYEGILKEGEREEAVFSMLQGQIDRDRDNYEKKVVQNRINGAKGGRPPKEPPNNPPVFEKTEKTQEEEKEKEKNKNKEKEKKEKPPFPLFVENDEDDDRENKQVYDKANECGLPTTKATHDALKNMIAMHGKDKVMRMLEKGASAKQFPNFVDFL